MVTPVTFFAIVDTIVGLLLLGVFFAALINVMFRDKLPSSVVHVNGEYSSFSTAVLHLLFGMLGVESLIRAYPVILTWFGG